MALKDCKFQMFFCVFFFSFEKAFHRDIFLFTDLYIQLSMELMSNRNVR
jgi:hypothetical protein